MIWNPIRIARCIAIQRDLDRKLAARKQARMNGQTLVSSYRRKA